jgi:hypothetical protein
MKRETQNEGKILNKLLGKWKKERNQQKVKVGRMEGNEKETNKEVYR